MGVEYDGISYTGSDTVKIIEDRDSEKIVFGFTASELIRILIISFFIIFAIIVYYRNKKIEDLITKIKIKE